MTASNRLISWMSCFLAGIVLGSPHFARPPWTAWLLACALTFMGSKAKGRAACFLFLITGGVISGILYICSWRNAVPIPWAFDQESSFVGTIVAPPDRRAAKTFLTLQPDGAHGARILISAGRYPAYQYGDRLELTGTIEKPEAFNGFNYPSYLEKDRVTGTVYQPKRLHVVSHNAGSPFLASLYRLRDDIEGAVQKTIPEPESGFLNGIMLGSKRAVPSDLQAALQNTGTSHIIAISGANITILLDILLQFLPLYTLRRQFWATAAIATFISLLTGASASVVRGAVIACLSRYARLNSRRAWVLPLILAGMFAMVLESPLLLVSDPGFQLSFAAFAGLGWLGTPCKNFIDTHRPFSRWPEAIRGSLAETAAASIGTAPISFTLFGQLSVLGLVVNPLILWLLPAVTLMGLTLCVAGWLPLVPLLVQMPLWLCLHAILGIISWFGRLDIGIIHWHPTWALSFDLWVVVGSLTTLIIKLQRHAPS